jgi:Starch-binding associating with outer membrane
MSTQNKIFLLLFGFGSILMASCTKKLNTNNNDPNGTPSSQLTGKDFFAGALVEDVNNIEGVNLYNATDNYDYANEWMQYFARNNGWAASGSQEEVEDFQPNNSFGDGNWGSLYHNIYDFNFVMANSSTGSILPGASRVMRVMLFQDLVDQFGNIPYSQAEQPLVTLAPAYDSAAAIYQDLMLQLDTALTAIAASQSTADDASDVMFGGNKTLWEQFANTVKLRVLLRQVPNGNQTYVATEIAKIVQQGSGFLTQDALVQPGFSSLPTKQNPFWNDYGPGSQNYNSFCASQIMINFLDSINDPRVGYYYAPSGAGSIGGETLGNNDFNQSSNTSVFGPSLLQSPSQAGVIMLAATSLFMQAEAVQRGLMSGNAAALYKQGVEASFNFLGVTNAVGAADSYMAGSTNGMVNFASSTNPLQTILYQKWIAECALDGLEAYCDYRRTGYPFIAQPSQGAPGLAVPQRLLYPETEYTQNSANVNSQNQAPADIYTPIFWAQP